MENWNSDLLAEVADRNHRCTRWRRVGGGYWRRAAALGWRERVAADDGWYYNFSGKQFSPLQRYLLSIPYWFCYRIFLCGIQRRILTIPVCSHIKTKYVTATGNTPGQEIRTDLLLFSVWRACRQSAVKFWPNITSVAGKQETVLYSVYKNFLYLENRIRATWRSSEKHEKERAEWWKKNAQDREAASAVWAGVRLCDHRFWSHRRSVSGQ